MMLFREVVVLLWEKVYEASGEDDKALYIIGSWILSFAVFVVMNVLFGVLDIFGTPDILRRFKIQKDKNVPMGLNKYLWTLIVATFNMTVVTAATLLVIWHAAAKSRMQFHPSNIPTAWRAALDIILCTIFNDIGFYYLHRLLHYVPILYKHIHKMHHNWTAPCAMATFYCHPIEQAVVNLGSFTLGPALVGSHLSTAWLFWVLGNVSTIMAHSGYHFPFFPSSQAHDYHHQKCLDQYSTLGVLDWLHGTNRHFKKSINSKRHFIMYGFTPADEIIKSE